MDACYTDYWCNVGHSTGPTLKLKRTWKDSSMSWNEKLHSDHTYSHHARSQCHTMSNRIMCARCSMCSSSFQAREGWRPLSPTMAITMPTGAVPATVPAWHGPRVCSGWFKGIKAQCGGFQFIDSCARIPTTVLFETACHLRLLPLFMCFWFELGALTIHLRKICFACTDALVMP